MPMFWFLLVVVSLGCGSLPANEVAPHQALIATMGVLLAWGLLAKIAALTTTHQLDQQVADAVIIVRVFERQISFLRWAGILAAAMCLVGFGLRTTIDSLVISQSSMAIRAALMITPAALIVMLVWWADHQFGVANQLVEGGFRQAWREAVAAFRLQGAWLVVPVLALLALIDVLLLIPGIPLGLSGAAVAIVALLVVPVCMPWMAQRIWQTETLHDGPHAWIHDIATATGFRTLAMRRWNTGQKASNGLVAGFLPRCRVMLLSDRLLDRLPNQQVAMIALHELAHLRRWHVPMRMAAVVPAWGIVWVAQYLMSDFAGSEAIAIAAAIAASLGCLHLISRRTELDADAVACQLAVAASQHTEHVPATLAAAARAMSEALDAVTAESPQSRRGTWLHPSVAKRQRALANLAATESDADAALPRFATTGQIAQV